MKSNFGKRDAYVEFCDDYVCGHVNVTDSELIHAGVYTSLCEGLEHIFAIHDTCTIVLH